jgi:hypothetical protein
MTPPNDGFLLTASGMPLASKNIEEKLEFCIPSEIA